MWNPSTSSRSVLPIDMAEGVETIDDVLVIDRDSIADTEGIVDVEFDLDGPSIKATELVGSTSAASGVGWAIVLVLMKNRKVEPSPSELITSIRPPSNSVIFRQMNRPRPEPPYRV